MRGGTDADGPDHGDDGKDSRRQPESIAPAQGCGDPSADRPGHEMSEHETGAKEGRNPAAPARIKPCPDGLDDGTPTHRLGPPVERPQADHEPQRAGRSKGQVGKGRDQHSCGDKPTRVGALAQRSVHQLTQGIDPQECAADEAGGIRVQREIGANGGESYGEIDATQVETRIGQPGHAKDAPLPALEMALSIQ